MLTLCYIVSVVKVLGKDTHTHTHTHMNQVHYLNKVICILHNANTIGEGMNPTFLTFGYR